MDPDTRVNPDTTVGELEERFEGQDFLAQPEKDHFVCDFCSKGVKYSSKPRVAQYIADDVLNMNHPKAAQIKRGRPLVQLASYCEECSKQQLFFPCEGVAEARVFIDLDKERVMRNVKATDASPRDDGIPWDPKELSEKITTIPFDANVAIAGGDHLWGPENMVTFFLSTVGEIDIRELVKWDGSIDPKLLGRARKEYEQFGRKMEQHGYSRKAFRDNVRG